MTKTATQILIDFLEKNNFEKWKSLSNNISNSVLQKLLWIADYFQMEYLQECCIRDLIIPRISYENVLIFINETYKKLKVCEDSNDLWYLLLNNCLNVAGKNLIFLYSNNYFEKNKVNMKLMEEIISRHIKNEISKMNFKYKEIEEILFKLKNVDDLINLLVVYRKEVSKKLSNIIKYIFNQ